MLSCGVGIFSNGMVMCVVMFDHEVAIFSRDVAMFGHGVAMFSHKVAMFGLGGHL